MRRNRALRAAVRWVRDHRVREDLRWEWRRRLAGEPALPPGPIRRVLVVCHGNLCRSPFAAALLARSAPGLEVRSAGLAAADGHRPDPSAVRCAARRGIDLEPHRTRRATTADVSWADLVVGMQGRHAAEARHLLPAASRRVHLLGDFLPQPPHAIPDPWGRDDECFEAVFRRVEEAVARLVERLRADGV